MKLRMFALLAALLLPTLSLAALTEMSVQVVPAKNTYTQGDTLVVSVSGDGAGMEYRYVLWRMGVEPAVVMASAWRAGTGLELVTGEVVTPSGNYRLVVAAREAANPANRLVNVRNFRVASEAEITAALQARFERAAASLRETFVRVIRRQGFGVDVSPEFYGVFRDAGQIAETLSGAEQAPGGGPAFVAGDANSETGAIGVEAVSLPSTPDDWRGSEVVLHMPAYAGLPATTVSVGYDTALLPAEVQAQRDLVVARYNDAIARTTAALRQVIRRQGFGIDITNEFGRFADSALLVDNVLNRSGKSAPRGGNAFVVGASGNAHTGAVGVFVEPPMQMDDWWGTSVSLHLPAFLGLEPQTTTVAYAAVLTEAEQQTQRDLVLARYQRAISEARELLANARVQLASYSYARVPYHALQDGETFITTRLNDRAHAPRGDRAWTSAGAGDEKTGAVAVEVVQPPASARQWAGTQLRVHLPAFLGLEAASTTISFDD